MKTLLTLLALALLAGLGAAEDPVPFKKCEGAADISCSAYATLSILTTGGTCKGSAKADCTAVGVSQSKYVEAYEEWWGGGDTGKLCDSNKITAAANAVATAIAEVWASAKAQVSCDGYGQACGYSISNGNAYAVGIAEALAQAAAEVVVGSQADAFCYADVRAVSAAIAEATAKADAAACIDGQGTSDSWNESYISAVATALADAFASASAAACANEDGTQASASSLCEGQSTSRVTQDVYSSGDVCGGVKSVPACTGNGAATCCDPSFERRLCLCKDCNGPWTLTSSSNDAKKIFEDRGKSPCFCLDGDTGPPPTVPIEPLEPSEPPSEPEEPVEPSEPPSEPDEPEEPVEPSEPPSEPEPAEPSGSTVSCPGSPDISCSAYAILQILTTEGTCSGSASASCESVTSTQNDYKEAYEEWWSAEGAVCDQGKAEAAAQAIGTATASVWAEATAKVKCDGVGFACGWSASGGEAWAITFAEAIAQAAAEASDPNGASDAFCFSDIRALSSAIADAAAQAQVDACTNGKEVTAYQEGLAVTIAEAVADAFATATAAACSEDGTASATSTCGGKGTSSVTEDKFTLGDACAATSTVNACKGPGKDMCCPSSFQRTICACMTKGCENGPWIKQTDFDTSTNTLRSLRDGKGEICFCT